MLMAVDMTETGARIAAARTEKGFTQEELGARLGVSAQAISKWERGISLPDTGLLPDLAAVVGTTVDFLLGGGKRLPAGEATLYSISASRLLDGYRIDPVRVAFGAGIIPLATPAFLERIGQIRVDILRRWGVLIPAVRVMDQADLPDRQVVVSLWGRPTAQAEYPEVSQAVGDDILSILQAQIELELESFVNGHMVKLLVENLRRDMPFAVEGIVPERVSLSLLRTVMKKMIGRGKPVTNLARIIEAADEAVGFSADPERIAGAL